MVTVWLKKETRKDGSIRRKVYVRVTADETITPLDALPPLVPVQKPGHRRTAVTVRVNRAARWGVWSCVDVPYTPQLQVRA